MRRLFIEDSRIYEDTIRAEGAVTHHIKNVYRLKKGDEITFTTGNNMDYVCVIRDFEGDSCICDILEKRVRDTELPVNITLYQGIPKSDKMDLIVQKAVELGASRIVPVSMQRSVAKYDSSKALKKIKRWNEIALNAMEQAGRTRLPAVGEVKTFKEALDEAATEKSSILIPYESAEGMENTRKILNGLSQNLSKKSGNIAIFIGPEGGFSPDEAVLAKDAGGSIFTLGKRILRTETAGLYLLSVLSYLFEE